MSEVVGEGVIRIRTDESGVDVDGAGARAGKGYTKGFGSGLKGLAGIIGGALVVSKGLDFAKTGVTDARNYAKAYAATEQIIKATGGAANVSAEQIGEMVGALEAKTAVDDEVIQRGANLLLTFKNVRNEVGKGNDVFARANKAALDLSAAGFGAVEGQAKMLGKALNDPVKGISALSRSGVTFTAEQQEMIKAMVEAGDTLGAQKIILGEVETQVGGTAEAQVNAADRAAVAWDNVRQQFGELLVPAIDAAANAFTDYLAPALFSALDAAEGIPALFSSIKDTLTGVTGEGSAVGGVFDGIRSAISDVLPVLQEGFAAALPTVLSFFDTLRGAVSDVLPVMADTFTNVVLPAVLSLADYLATSLWPVFQQVAGIITGSLIPAVVEVATFLYGTLYPAIVGIVTAVAQNLKPVFDALVQTFQTQVLPTVKRLIDQFRNELVPALQPIIQRVVQVIGFLVKLAAAILGKVLPPLIRLAGFIIANVVPAVVSIITWVARVIGKVIEFGAALVNGVRKVAGFGSALVSLVTGGISKVVSAVADLPGRILALGGRMLDAGKAIIGKFVDGLKAAGGVVGDIAGNVWNAVKGLLNDAIDRINSALEFKISLPGPDININPPNIPHLAKGTDYFDGGWAVVGEKGRELVTLPRGARVTPNPETERILGGGAGDGGGNVYIGTLMPHNYSEFERQMREQKRLAALGGRRPVTA